VVDCTSCGEVREREKNCKCKSDRPFIFICIIAPRSGQICILSCFVPGKAFALKGCWGSRSIMPKVHKCGLDIFLSLDLFLVEVSRLA
jgi:hypothetical protein